MKKFWADLNIVQRVIIGGGIPILILLLGVAYSDHVDRGAAATSTAGGNGTSAVDNMKYDPLTREALDADRWAEGLEEIYKNRHGWQSFNDAPAGTWHNEIISFTAGIHGDLEVLISGYDDGTNDALAHQVATNIMMDLYDYEDAPTSVSAVTAGDRKTVVTITSQDVGL